VAIVLFMLDTGVRASELCGLAFEDLSYDWSFARVMGKGRKKRYVPISPKAIRPMQRYVLVERRSAGPFCRSYRGNALTSWDLNQLFACWSERSGIYVHPHRLRYTFAVECLRSGGNLPVRQRQLGHTTLTIRYLNLITDDLVAARQPCSPVTRLT
jgi:integrase